MESRIESTLWLFFSLPHTLSSFLAKILLINCGISPLSYSGALHFSISWLYTESSVFILVLHLLPSKHSLKGKQFIQPSLRTCACLFQLHWKLSKNWASIFSVPHSEFFLSGTQEPTGPFEDSQGTIVYSFYKNIKISVLTILKTPTRSKISPNPSHFLRPPGCYRILHSYFPRAHIDEFVHIQQLHAKRSDLLIHFSLILIARTLLPKNRADST